MSTPSCGAIGAPTLKAEQARIGSAIEAATERLADLDANLTEQQEILDLAASLATRCGDACRKANDRTHKLFNAAVFERLDAKGGQLCQEQYRPLFDGVFTVSEFEYGTRVVLACHYANTLAAVQAPVIVLSAPNSVLRHGHGDR